MSKHLINSLLNHLDRGDELPEKERQKWVRLLKKGIQEKDGSKPAKLLNVLAEACAALYRNENLPEALDECFGIIGHEIPVDRIYYFEIGRVKIEGEEVLNQVVEWSVRSELAQIGNPDLQKIPANQMKDFIEPLKNDKPFKAVIRELPEGRLKDLLRSQDILSILVFPIIVKKQLYGFIGFDDCTTEREWGDEEVAVIRTLASQMTNKIELNEVERILDRTYNQARIGTWEMDLITDKFYWSSVTRSIFELEPEPEQEPEWGTIFSFFKKEEDRLRIQAAIDKSIRTGETYDFEIEIITAKGNRKWIRDTGQAELRNGRAVRVHGTVQDIDKYKRAELESQRNKQLLEAITAQTQVAIVVRDKNGKNLFVNREWKKVFGMQGKQVVGKTIFDLFEKSTADHIHRVDNSVLKEDRQRFIEEKVNTEDGPRYFLVNKFPIKGIAGMENTICGIGTDFTEVKEAKERLQLAEQKLRDVVEYSTNLFYSHTADHELLYISPQSQYFLGCSPEEAQKNWTEFVTLNPLNQKGFRITEKAIRTGKAQPAYELELRKTDGQIIWVEVNEAPIVKDGKTVLMVGSLTDITDRKKVRAAIRSSLREKETLLSEIHHRVKNNLAVIASMMQVQAYSDADESVSSRLIESVLRIKSMATIHEHLYKSKSFSRLDLSENIKSLIISIKDTMQFETSIEVEYDCEKVLLNVNQAIPFSLIMNEVVTNIIKHAFSGLEEAKIQVSLTVTENRIHLEITDNGSGLPEDFSVENSHTLGLRLIKILAEQLQAEYLYTPLERGTTFSLMFEKQESGGSGSAHLS